MAEIKILFPIKKVNAAREFAVRRLSIR